MLSLPRKLAKTISDAGYRAIHTLLLPNANKTTNADINKLSITENWVVITKDSDFVDSFLLNIQNIALAFETNYYLELNKTNLLIHQ
jgi:predicted nuclease of predicted toxin-antitoxin system